MSDPYGGAYVTAGDPYLATDGSSLASADSATQTAFHQAYGEDAPIVYAEQANQTWLTAGRAIKTTHGVMALDNVRFALNKAGYNGPTDAASLASAYEMLQAPPQPTPLPGSGASVGANIGGLQLGGSIGGIPRTLIYAGVGIVAYMFLFGRRRNPASAPRLRNPGKAARRARRKMGQEARRHDYNRSFENKFERAIFPRDYHRRRQARRAMRRAGLV